MIITFEMMSIRIDKEKSKMNIEYNGVNCININEIFLKRETDIIVEPVKKTIIINKIFSLIGYV